MQVPEYITVFTVLVSPGRAEQSIFSLKLLNEVIMLDHVKVNQNSIINLLKSPDKESSDFTSKKPGTDFFAMVLEKSNFDDKRSRAVNTNEQYADNARNNTKSETAEPKREKPISETEVLKSGENRQVKSAEKEKVEKQEPESKEQKIETKQGPEEEDSAEKVKSLSEDIKSKKNSDDEPEEEMLSVDQLQDEKSIKNLLDIIKAAFSGNKKSEEESFEKLFSNLKFKQDKDKISLGTSSKKNETDKNHKSNSDSVKPFMKDLKELISKEIAKGLDNRKSLYKHQPLSDKELKELASNIIEGIKKNKAKDIVKHEAKIVSGEEIKNDKKLIPVTVDEQLTKKISISDDTSSDKSGGKDKNSGRENFSYNGGKLEFSSKSGIDRIEHNQKMPDFKENLQEIIDKAKVSVRDSRNGTFTVKLNPQELGNVNVNLIMENGVITGKFLVDNEDVKSMLLNSLNDLKTQMEEAGIAVGEFSVNVDDQREKYLKQKDDEELRSLSFMNKDKEVIAAAEQYNSNSAAHTGHINMVI